MIMRIARGLFRELVICIAWWFCLVNVIEGGNNMPWVFGLALATVALALSFMVSGYKAALMHHPRHGTITDQQLNNFITHTRVQCGDHNPNRTDFVVNNDFLRFLVKYTLITFTVYDQKLPAYELEKEEEQQA